MIDALVIGGGPAGAAVALRLARAGRAVVLVEREEPGGDKMCGEFVSGEAAEAAAALGVPLPPLGADPIHAVRLCRGGGEVTVPLPFPALSLSRRRLDDALLDAAAAAGVSIERGVAVTALGGGPGAWVAKLADTRELRAGAVFCANGKHDLAGRPRAGGRQRDLVAFKLYWRLASAQAAALAGHVELHLFDGGYLGLQNVEGGRTNLCLLVRQQTLARVGRTWPALFARIRASCPHLDHRLEGAAALDARPRVLAAIPYGYVRRRSDGPWYLGDQAAVIPSFAGDGMALALHSAALAATMHLAGDPPGRFQAVLAADLAGQVRRATWVSQALVRPIPQAACMALAQRWPALVAAVARSTRLSSAAQARLAAPVSG